jgi:hypothetical protein
MERRGARPTAGRAQQQPSCCLSTIAPTQQGSPRDGHGKQVLLLQLDLELHRGWRPGVGGEGGSHPFRGGLWTGRAARWPEMGQMGETGVYLQGTRLGTLATQVPTFSRQHDSPIPRHRAALIRQLRSFVARCSGWCGKTGCFFSLLPPSAAPQPPFLELNTS